MRSHIQQLNNVNFVFSGSNRRLLTSMFSDSGRPFYQNSDFLLLGKIEENTYCRFIREKFAKHGKSIATNLVKEAMEYYNIHTFYVQYFFNRLFERTETTATKAMADQVHRQIPEERGPIYYTCKALLTPVPAPAAESHCPRRRSKPAQRLRLHCPAQPEAEQLRQQGALGAGGAGNGVRGKRRLPCLRCVFFKVAGKNFLMFKSYFFHV